MGAFDGELTALGIHPNSNETTTKPPLYMWWQGGDIVEVYEKHPYTGRARIKTVYGMRYEVHVDHLEPITDEILVAVNAKLMGILEKHSKFNPYTVHALAAKRIRDLEQRLADAEAELEQYRTKRLLCWDEANPEHGSYDEQGIAEYFADNMADDESHPFFVMRALSLPDREMIVTLSGGEERKITWEWVDAARPEVKCESI